MAIVEMTRVSLVGPVAGREAALQAVADAGVLHLRERTEPSAPAGRVTEPMTEPMTERDQLAALLDVLPPGEESQPVPWAGLSAARAELAGVQSQVARRDEAVARRERLLAEREQTEPWGEVTPAARRRLAEHGVSVRVYEGRLRSPDALELDGLDWAEVVERPGGRVRVRVVTRGQPEIPLHPLEPPARSAAEIRTELEEVTQQLQEHERALVQAAKLRPVLQRALAELDRALELRRVAASLPDQGPLYVLEGYCPTDRLDRLRAVRAEHSMVLVTAEPGPDDEAPVALRNGPVVRTFEPLVAAFKLPTYDELDPTPLLAPFMGLFFALCLGDLGYGALLTALAGAVLLRGRLPASARLLMRWALVLGVTTMVVGALLGNLFGLRFHELLGLSPSALLFSLVEDPGRLLAVSLGLGVVQLSFGMALRLYRDVRRQKFQAAIGSLAWLSVIPTVGLAYAGVLPWWPFGVVCGVLLLFAAPVRSLWQRLGRGAWALYDVIGLLANVMSYARIFGLGLSSGIIAMVVNTIAAVLADGPIGTAAAVLLLVVGHAFNFAMAVIGSMVHPARLQLLEFFNTFFTGGGRAYAPLGRTCQGE
ncbi:MAG: hypothetical protein AAGF11_30165 [Myxococcota bacterium]